MTDWFISDIHLEDGRPEITAQFVTTLRSCVRGAQRLFLLGDVFESWVGDDDETELSKAVADELSALADQGTAVFFCHGNRDFLLGHTFAARCGMTLLDEESVIDCFGTLVLLMHGDSLCVDDTEYQAFRSMTRDPGWQQQVLALPLAQRHAMAAAARQESKEKTSQLAADIMDVNQDAVEAALHRHSVTTLLHGHTHRPAEHRFDAAGSPCLRLVLGDWYNQGSAIRWDQSGWRRLQLDRMVTA